MEKLRAYVNVIQVGIKYTNKIVQEFIQLNIME